MTYLRDIHDLDSSQLTCLDMATLLATYTKYAQYVKSIK